MQQGDNDGRPRARPGAARATAAGRPREVVPPRALGSLPRLEVTTMPLSFPVRPGSRHGSPRAEDLPSDATLYLPQGLPLPDRGLLPARRPGPVPPHGTTPPRPAPKGKCRQPLLYWRPVAAAG